MLYAFLKTLSWLASHTPYKLLVKLGKGLGHILWHVLKKQRVRAEDTIHERLGYSRRQSKEVIRKMFVNLGISGEYKLNRKVSLWLEGDNLLNHDIRISPLISECGPSIIVGASLTL